MAEAEETTIPTTEPNAEVATEPTTTTTAKSNTKIVLKQEALGILRRMYAETSDAASNLSGKTVSSDSTMQALKSAGLETGFASSFDSMIANVISSLSTIINTMINAYETVSGVDIDVNNLIPKTNEKRGTPSGSGNGGNLPSGSSQAKVADQQNYYAQILSYSSMSLNDLSTIATLLRETAEKNNISVSSLLNDEKYEEVLKKVLLENNLDETLLSLIEDGGSATVQKALRDIMSGKNGQVAIGVDDDTLMTLNYYLVNIANQYNMTLGELLSEDNSKLLKTSLSQFSKLSETISDIDSKDFQSKIEKIYLEEPDDVGKALLKLNIDVNGGINDENYSYDKLENLGKFALFMETLSDYDSKKLYDTLLTIYGVSNNKI